MSPLTFDEYGPEMSRSSTPSVSFLALRYVTERTRRNELTGGSPKTTRAILLAFAKGAGNPAAGELARHHIERWLNSMTVGASTVRMRLSTVHVFCQWLILNGYLRTDPTLGVKPPRQPRAVPRALPAASVSQLLERLPDSRARLIALLMVQEGLRAIEVSNLQAGDLDEVNGMIFVVGKGGNQRVLPVSAETMRAFRRYVADVPLVAGPLVRSYNNPHRALSAGYISGRMSLWMSQAGIKRFPRDGISGHALRHTAATDALAHGATPREVQEMLGHESLATTQRYLRVRPENLRRAMGGREYGGPALTFLLGLAGIACELLRQLLS